MGGFLLYGLPVSADVEVIIRRSTKQRSFTTSTVPLHAGCNFLRSTVEKILNLDKWARFLAYRNARENSDRQNARIEHDEALRRVMTAVINDDMQLFKQFTDNESFRRWMTDNVFGLTYSQPQAKNQTTVRD